MRKHALSTFVINVLIHIYQKDKIASEIAGNCKCKRALTEIQLNNIVFCNLIGSKKFRKNSTTVYYIFGSKFARGNVETDL